MGGLPFVEVLSVTRLESGIADNVIPDQATATLNLRYPPDRSPEEAEAFLRSLVPRARRWTSRATPAPAPSSRTTPWSPRSWTQARGRSQPKQAWTNVADFTAHGIDAVNFGPGHTRYAHRRDEQVEIAALVHAYETLERLVRGAIGEDGA